MIGESHQISKKKFKKKDDEMEGFTKMSLGETQEKKVQNIYKKSNFRQKLLEKRKFNQTFDIDEEGNQVDISQATQQSNLIS